MKILPPLKAVVLLFSIFIIFSACGGRVENQANSTEVSPTVNIDSNQQNSASNNNSPNSNTTESKIPNLQKEILDPKNSQTTAPIGQFDFKNYTYPLPRGWQDSDSKEAELINGKRPMSRSEEEEKIGLSYLTTKFFDTTGDGQDEAFVILKIDTGGSAIPQLVYAFIWKNDKPELVWNFRTGDRADGGLKDIRIDNGEIVIELYGQDRYIVGELDTAKITGDEEQLCCPTYFTQSRYKWNGTNFRIQGKRLTYSIADTNAPAVENMGEAVEKQKGGKK